MNGGQNSAPLFVLQHELLSQLSQLQKIKKNLFSFLLRKRKIKKDEWKFFKFSKKKMMSSITKYFHDFEEKILGDDQGQKIPFF